MIAGFRNCQNGIRRVAGVVLQFGRDVEAVDVVGLVRRHQMKSIWHLPGRSRLRKVRGLHLLAIDSSSFG